MCFFVFLDGHIDLVHIGGNAQNFRLEHDKYSKEPTTHVLPSLPPDENLLYSAPFTKRRYLKWL
jgi:hypothetical protein